MEGATMVKENLGSDSYPGFPMGMGTYPEVWQVNRLPAERYEIGCFYKPALIRFDDGELLCMPFLMKKTYGNF